MSTLAMFMHVKPLSVMLGLSVSIAPHGAGHAADRFSTMTSHSRQITQSQTNHILTNIRVWSPDGKWIVYDTRSDLAGDHFDGSRIEMVNVETGETRLVFQSSNGAHCGVALFHPREVKVVFIHGPEHPTPDWQYAPFHRHGVIVDANRPGVTENLDARDIIPPFTPGALRGGSHVHVWDPAGQWVSFTYEDHVLARFFEETSTQHINLRNIGVSVPWKPVVPSTDHPRNHAGSHFSVLVSRTTAYPQPGSDEIKKAFEEGWVGDNGYVRQDGTRQRRALAFQGHVVTAQDVTIAEVYIVDLPEDVSAPGDGPLAGTSSLRPAPPAGTTQRRLTFTADRRFPGIQGPRHWLRSAPDGSAIAFLMKDDAGVVQLWTVPPTGGSPRQVTTNQFSVESAFSWSPDGSWITHLMDNAVCLTSSRSGKTTRLTPSLSGPHPPRPEACVFSPSGRQVAWARPMATGGKLYNQIFVTTFEPESIK